MRESSLIHGEFFYLSHRQTQKSIQVRKSIKFDKFWPLGKNGSGPVHEANGFYMKFYEITRPIRSSRINKLGAKSPLSRDIRIRQETKPILMRPVKLTRFSISDERNFFQFIRCSFYPE